MDSHDSDSGIHRVHLSTLAFAHWKAKTNQQIDARCQKLLPSLPLIPKSKPRAQTCSPSTPACTDLEFTLVNSMPTWRTAPHTLFSLSNTLTLESQLVYWLCPPTSSIYGTAAPSVVAVMASSQLGAELRNANPTATASAAGRIPAS